jgi:hypothetical protein
LREDFLLPVCDVLEGFFAADDCEVEDAVLFVEEVFAGVAGFFAAASPLALGLALWASAVPHESESKMMTSIRIQSPNFRPKKQKAQRTLAL